MAINKIDVNKYKITIELGYDILGNRKRKTELSFVSKKPMRISGADSEGFEYISILMI